MPVVKEIEGKYCNEFPKYINKSLINGVFIEEALTTSEAIRKYSVYGRVAAMNFANGFVPGGGAAFHRGDRIVRTQEENILALTPDAYEALLENRDLYPLCKNGNRSLYLSNVSLSKNDDFTESEEIYFYDMLVAPAINVHDDYFVKKRKYKSDEHLINKHMRPMLHNLLIECAKNRVTTVVLGPWGCGVFAPHHDVEKEVYVRKVMEMMYKVCASFIYYFKNIVFTKPFVKSKQQLMYENFRRIQAEQLCCSSDED